MKEIKIEKCPYCDGKEFIECTVNSYGGVYVERKIHSAWLYATVCRDCGSVVRTYVKYPEKLYPKKERRAD